MGKGAPLLNPYFEMSNLKRVRVRAPRVLVDEWLNHGRRIGRAGPYWCHLTVEGFAIDRLHAFARKLGLNREWFQDHHPRPELWHYDIGSQRLYDRAQELGAVFVPGMDQAHANLRARRLREASSFTQLAECGTGLLGEPIKSLGTLYGMLRDWEIDPIWQANFGVRPATRMRFVSSRLPAPCYADPSILRFEGNFARYSFGFRLDTNDPALILALKSAQAHQPKAERFNP